MQREERKTKSLAIGTTVIPLSTYRKIKMPIDLFTTFLLRHNVVFYMKTRKPVDIKCSNINKCVKEITLIISFHFMRLASSV